MRRKVSLFKKCYKGIYIPLGIHLILPPVEHEEGSSLLPPLLQKSYDQGSINQYRTSAPPRKSFLIPPATLPSSL